MVVERELSMFLLGLQPWSVTEVSPGGDWICWHELDVHQRTASWKRLETREGFSQTLSQEGF